MSSNSSTWRWSWYFWPYAIERVVEVCFAVSCEYCHADGADHWECDWVLLWVAASSRCLYMDWGRGVE